MFKKIEIWILYLTLLLSILFAIGFGALVRQELVGNTKAGWVSKTALTLAEIPVNTKKILAGDNLALEDRFPGLDGFNGTPNTEESYLLLSRYDGDIQEGVVELIDLRNFEILHTWNPDIDEFNDLVDKSDEYKFLDRDINDSRAALYHPKLTTDGGLLFTQNMPLRKINSCSELIFQNSQNIFHHSIETDLEGNIWAPSHLYPSHLPINKVGESIISEGGFYDDALVKLSPDGAILYEKSVSQIFIDNHLEHLIFAHGSDFERDPIHLNDIQPVNHDSEYWKKGDVFLSMRNQSMIMLYRPSTNKVIWLGNGPFFQQHDVDILDDHRISIFNNNSKNFFGGNIVDGHNSVVIYNFRLDKYSSYLSNSLIEEDVTGESNGRSQILLNNDLLVEQTIYARTLYFNADGSLRWTHVNRAGNGNVYWIAWSRILYNREDIQSVNNFLTSKGTCNE